tara:strand:- start:957 stop:1277 length:321 start_codon:yes stop_codon:yes gene_type:complete
MFIFIVKNILLSVVVILLLHYIYNYLKNNLTTPKVKDLVHKPKIRYNQIIEVIKNSEMENIKNDLKEDEDEMKDELEKYMQSISENLEEPSSSLESNTFVSSFESI